MKKIISSVLSIAIILSCITPALAAAPLSSSASNVIGEIYFSQTTPSVQRNSSASPSSATKHVNTIISGSVNTDGSVTTYQYEDGVLIEYHTTIPGSGRVESTYIDADGSIYSKVTFTKSPTLSSNEYVPSNSAIPTPLALTDYSESEILDPTSIRNLGYMHYRNPWTQEIFSIDCEVIEKYHGYEYHTFYEGAADTLSFWTNTIISVFTFQKTLANKVADAIFQRLLGYGVFALGVDGLYHVLITKRVPCYWYDQEIHGTPTAPSGRGEECYLPGVYAYADCGNGLEVIKEGYTVADWGNPSMGRWMMYNVFGIDEAPTSWTNLDLR